MKTNLAKTISIVSLPYLLALITIFLLLASTRPILDSLYWTAITLCFVVGLPAVFVYFQKKSGKISNHNVDVRAQRKPVYLVGIFSLFIGIMYLQYMNAPSKLTISMYVVCIVGFIAFITNRFIHKTSAHMIGIGLAFSLLFHDYPTISIILMLFSIPVAWSRLHLKKHTFPEVLTGLLISSTIGIMMSYYFF